MMKLVYDKNKWQEKYKPFDNTIQLNEFNDNRFIPAHELEALFDNYKKDFINIFNLAAQLGKKIIYTNMPVNYFWKPMSSYFRNNITETEKKNFFINYNSAVNDYNKQNYESAYQYFQDCINIDDTPAIVNNYIGRILHKQGLRKEARSYFEKSVDNDWLPLRFMTKQNTILKDISTSNENILFIDAVSKFNNLIYDYVLDYTDIFTDIHHCNLRGHTIISDLFINEFKKVINNKPADIKDNISLNKLKISKYDEIEKLLFIIGWFISMAELSPYETDFYNEAEKYIDLLNKNSKHFNNKQFCLYKLFQAIISVFKYDNKDRCVNIINNLNQLHPRIFQNILYSQIILGVYVIDYLKIIIKSTKF